MFSIFILSILSYTLHAAVTRFTLTQPAPGTTWTSSTPVTISWSFDPTDTSAASSTLKLDLYYTTPEGKDRAIATIAGIVPASQGSIQWVAPEVKVGSSGWWIKLERNKEKSGIASWFEGRDEAHSGVFRIEPNPNKASGGGMVVDVVSSGVDANANATKPTPTLEEVTTVVTVKPTATAKTTCNEVQMKEKCLAEGKGFSGGCQCSRASRGVVSAMMWVGLMGVLGVAILL